MYEQRSPAQDNERALRGAQQQRILTLGLILVALIGAAAWTLAGAKVSGSMQRLELTLAAILLAGILASMVGFAFSAIAAAFIAPLYPDPVEMVRILLVCSITIQAYCTLMLVKSIRWRELAPYLAGGLLTAPLGVFLLTRVSSHVYAAALGAFLVVYGLYSLCKPVSFTAQPSRGLDVFVGALGGLTGGLAAFPGAIPVLWCSARGLPKESQRAICQPFIFFMQIATLAMVEYVRPTNMTAASTLWIFVPVSLIAAGLGFGVFRRLSHSQFRVVVLSTLVVSGSILVFTSR